MTGAVERRAQPRCQSNCGACWLTDHDGHDIGTRRENGLLVSATCHDCGASYHRTEERCR